jgi:hypothetical protein
VVNDEMEIVQSRGKTGPYLEPPSGQPTFSLSKMTREGLLVDLRSALTRARNDQMRRFADSLIECARSHPGPGRQDASAQRQPGFLPKIRGFVRENGESRRLRSGQRAMDIPKTARVAGKYSPQQRTGGRFRGASRFFSSRPTWPNGVGTYALVWHRPNREPGTDSCFLIPAPPPPPLGQLDDTLRQKNQLGGA